MSKVKHTHGTWTVLGPVGAGSMIAAKDGETVLAYIAVVYGPDQTKESAGNSELIAASPEMLEALRAYQKLDDFHANCPECGGLEQPETCAKCFPLADDARLKMRAVLAKV